LAGYSHQYHFLGELAFFLLESASRLKGVDQGKEINSMRKSGASVQK
jgi:hypothetical protein